MATRFLPKTDAMLVRPLVFVCAGAQGCASDFLHFCVRVYEGMWVHLSVCLPPCVRLVPRVWSGLCWDRV